jgi:hypothetical protein
MSTTENVKVNLINYTLSLLDCKRRATEKPPGKPPAAVLTAAGVKNYFDFSLLFFDGDEGHNSAAKSEKASEQPLLALQSQQPDLRKSAMQSPPRRYFARCLSPQ